MTGENGKRLWERVVEPVRREQAKVLAGNVDARLGFPGRVEMLGEIRLGLIDVITRQEDGVLAEITSEFLGMQKLAKSFAGGAGV